MQAQEDPYIWLEEVESEKSLEFVEKLNESTFAKLSSTDKYEEIYDKVLAINNATDRIEYPTIYGSYIYNFWKDKDNVRGIWRRSDKSSYLSGSPNWETLLDLDKLSADDDIKWVYKGASGLYPDYSRFLLRLSKGGADAVVIKEFDVNTMAFIEDGFYIPESKGGASCIDKNTLIVSTNFGDNTMTTSGYPNQAKIWKRG